MSGTPRRWLRLARRLRAKRSQLEEAFVGHASDHHGFLLGKMLTRVDMLDGDIAEPDRKIEELIAPFAAADRPDGIPGVGPTTAQVIIAEVGWTCVASPTPAHLASWARFAPG